MKPLPPAQIIAAAALSLAACAPPEPSPVVGRHVVCTDKFTGAPAFSLWDDTATERTLCLGCPSYATFTLDDRRRVRISTADLDRHDCRVDATRTTERKADQ